MTVFDCILVCPAAILICLSLVPRRLANARVGVFRQIVTVVAGLQFVIAACLLAAFGLGRLPELHAELLAVPGGLPIAVNVYYDGVSALMFALVSFVGWVICRYSIRYLDGEATQGRYFCWTAFSIGSVSLMVVSGNLLMFFVAWVMTSLGLHHLLLHYPQRTAAQRAAWSKFSISRVGDAALICAISMILVEFKTLDFKELFAAIASQSGRVGPTVHLASFLLVAGAVTKSAQFPFHTWLPLTMETPTPVSALMHAGIVNAGGYLIIRSSPIVSLTPSALTTLALVGAVTAGFAAVVMLTQTSVKKKLAYSTIAQMGFMLLQCGLGAFSAAMLHILAHSLYKAHAFLSSGSVLRQRAAMNAPAAEHRQVAFYELSLIAAVMATFLTFSFLIFRMDPMTKPGGLLLGTILCLALTYWCSQVLRTGSKPLVVRCLGVSALLCLLYLAGLTLVDVVTAEDLPVAQPSYAIAVSATIAVIFFALFGLHRWLGGPGRSAWLDAWYVHASNGFYFENSLRRMFGALARS